MDPKLAPGQFDTVIVDNGATIINDGVVQGVDLSPLSRILVTSTESTFINNDTLNVLEVSLRGSATLNNDGTMNTVRISTLTGTLNNSGLIDDAQLSFQFGTVNNEAGGTVNTTFTLSTMGSRFINNTVFDNYGTLTNEASINNEGIFNNFGTFDNTNGTFDNQGAFNSECGSILLGTISGNPANETPCNAAPVVDAGVNQTVNEGDPVSLDPATFTDADVTDIHTATINWGDSSPMESGIISESGGSGTVSGSHVYTDDGTYTVTVCVADDTVEACASLIVTVNNGAPVINSLTATSPINENDSTVLGASFADPGSLDTHTVVINWGDSQSSTIDLNNGELTFFATHQYLDDNPSGTTADEYDIVVTVTDDDAGMDAAATTVTVNNVAPSVEAGPDRTVDEGSPVIFSGSFSDPGADTHTMEWNFGDGSPPVTGTLTPTHAYGDNGVYTVTLTVTDDDLGAGYDTLTVTVNDLGPMSAFSWSPEPQYEGSAVVFSDASTSYPDSVVSWSWDFAGLGVSSDQNPTFSFTDDGVYPVSLTVADEDSSADTTMNIVTVINVAPIVSGGPDQNVYIGETTDVMATFTDAWRRR